MLRVWTKSLSPCGQVAFWTVVGLLAAVVAVFAGFLIYIVFIHEPW